MGRDLSKERRQDSKQVGVEHHRHTWMHSQCKGTEVGPLEKQQKASVGIAKREPQSSCA